MHLKMLKLQYGFLADPAKETWENVKEYFESMPLEQFFVGRPTNMACHNICTDVEAPVGIEHLLGLGGKYCEKKTKLNRKTLDEMFRRLRSNIRWKYIYSATKMITKMIALQSYILTQMWNLIRQVKK